MRSIKSLNLYIRCNAQRDVRYNLQEVSAVSLAKTIIRRKFLKGAAATGAALSTGVVATGTAQAARPGNAFEAESVSDALSALFETADAPAESADIEIKAPDIAENGAVVPIKVTNKLEGASTLSILVEKNPQPLAASFELTGEVGQTISTRIKMGETSRVHAVVKTADQVMSASREIKVTIGGCGG